MISTALIRQYIRTPFTSDLSTAAFPARSMLLLKTIELICPQLCGNPTGNIVPVFHTPSTLLWRTSIRPARVHPGEMCCYCSVVTNSTNSKVSCNCQINPGSRYAMEFSGINAVEAVWTMTSAHNSTSWKKHLVLERGRMVSYQPSHWCSPTYWRCHQRSFSRASNNF